MTKCTHTFYSLWVTNNNWIIQISLPLCFYFITEFFFFYLKFNTLFLHITLIEPLIVWFIQIILFPLILLFTYFVGIPLIVVYYTALVTRTINYYYNICITYALLCVYIYVGIRCFCLTVSHNGVYFIELV